MIKKDISKILTQGSIKKRALLFFSDLAKQAFEDKGILTNSERKKLFDSFKTEKEINIYNKYRRIDQTMRYSVIFLTQYKFSYKERIEKAIGFLSLSHTQQKAEELINLIIEALDPKKEKTSIIEDIINKENWFYPAHTQIDNEGYININTEEASSPSQEGTAFDFLLELLLKKATEILIECKTIIKLMEDFLEENSFEVRAYYNYIKKVEEELKREPILMNNIYSSEKFKNLEYEYPSLIKKYLILPQYEELEIDQDFYNETKATVLRLK